MEKIGKAKPGPELDTTEGLDIEQKELKVPKKPVKVKTEDEVPKIDVVQKVIEMHNEGYATSKIGLILRDKYSVKNVKKATGKTVTQILDTNNLTQELPEDLSDLLKRAVKLIKHMKDNKYDQTSKLGYLKTVSKIRRLARYYKRVGKLPKGWLYTAEKAAVLVK